MGLCAITCQYRLSYIQNSSCCRLSLNCALINKQTARLLLLQPIINGLEVRTPDPLHFLAVLQHHKGRHGSNLELLSHPPHLIHIDLEEPDILIFLTEFSDLRGNGLTGAAPGCVEVDKDGAGRSEGLEDHVAVCAEPY